MTKYINIRIYFFYYYLYIISFDLLKLGWACHSKKSYKSLVTYERTSACTS